MYLLQQIKDKIYQVYLKLRSKFQCRNCVILYQNILLTELAHTFNRYPICFNYNKAINWKEDEILKFFKDFIFCAKILQHIKYPLKAKMFTPIEKHTKLFYIFLLNARYLTYDQKTTVGTLLEHKNYSTMAYFMDCLQATLLAEENKTRIYDADITSFFITKLGLEVLEQMENPHLTSFTPMERARLKYTYGLEIKI